MKIFIASGLSFLLFGAISCGPKNPYPESSGNLFMRQQIDDLRIFKTNFLTPALKNQGFTAYSLHRDLKDPKIYILTLKCSNLRKAVKYVESSNFQTLTGGTSSAKPTLWAGIDVRERTYENRTEMTGGIVIANNQVRSYDFWKKCFDAEGQHHHADRGYTASHYSIHHLSGTPDVVLVVHEASDLSKAPAFMNSEAMRGIMEASGVVGVEIWYGTNLEEKTF